MKQNKVIDLKLEWLYSIARLIHFNRGTHLKPIQHSTFLSFWIILGLTQGCFIPGSKRPGSKQANDPTNTSSHSETDPESSESETTSSGLYYSTKTNYKPQQDAKTYQTPPAGYKLAFFQLVSRHSSRGSSSPDSDLIVAQMIDKAKTEGALTPLGLELETDIRDLIRVNATLGEGITGISKPGYGNLSQLGIREHTDLATRVVKRFKPYFESILAAAGTDQKRTIKVSTSGVNRAQDSAYFFTESLNKNIPGLKALLAPSSPVDTNPSLTSAAGINRYLLYFHKLNEKDDLVTVTDHPFTQIYQDSLAYQAFKKDPELLLKLKELESKPEVEKAAKAILQGIFKTDFISKIADGTHTFSNTGTYEVKGKDGATVTITGEGDETASTLVQAAMNIYDVYSIAPSLRVELGKSFKKYIADEQASIFAALTDGQEFYQKGPSLSEKAQVTSKMAQGLVADLFDETDHIAAGDLDHGAYLRFAHAEQIIPLATALGIKKASVAIPMSQTFSHLNNAWRGADVSPLTANFQWEVYQNADQLMLVRLLYNEKETSFKAACDGARLSKDSYFYEYAKLKTCFNL